MGKTPQDETNDVVGRMFAGKTVHFEVEFETPKGNRRVFDILDIPLPSESDEVERVLGFGCDITRIRRQNVGANSWLQSLRARTTR
jgi:hypothetical protein